MHRQLNGLVTEKPNLVALNDGPVGGGGGHNQGENNRRPAEKYPWQHSSRGLISILQIIQLVHG